MWVCFRTLGLALDPAKSICFLWALLLLFPFHSVSVNPSYNLHNNSNHLRGTYEEKLAKIGLTTLQERRIRGDCIETFKMLKGFTRVNHEIWFSIMSRAEGAQTRLSSDPLVLNSQLARLDLRKNFYSVRVPQIWNSLPLSVRQSTSVNQFKNAYDNHKSQI